MAEAKKLKIELEVDDSDVKRKLQRIDVKPVDIEVKKPKPVKVTVNPKVDDSGVKGLVKSLGGVRHAATRVLQAFGVFSMGAGLVMGAVAAVGKLVDMMTATRRAIEEMRMHRLVEGVSEATDVLIGKQGRLLQLLRDELETMQRQKDLRDTAKTQQRTAEDATRKLSQDERMAGVTDQRERERLQRQFADEDEAVARRRSDEDRAAQVADIDQEESAYRAKANGIPEQQKRIDDQIAETELAIKKTKSTKSSQQRGWYELGGLLTPGSVEQQRQNDAENDPEVKQLREKLKQLRKAREELEKEREKLKEEADYRKAKIGILQDGQPSKADQVAEDESKDRARKSADAARDRADRKANADTRESMSRAEAKDDFERSYKRVERMERDARTPQDRDAAQQQQVAMLEGQEDEAKKRLRKAEEELAEEMKKDAAQRDEERMARARANMREAQSDMFGARSRREDLEDRIRAERQRKIDTHFDGLANQIDAGRPKNRLTAMGLGSGGGVAVDRTAQEQASNVRLLVQIAKEQLAATRANKPKQGYATFAP